MIIRLMVGFWALMTTVAVAQETPTGTATATPTDTTTSIYTDLPLEGACVPVEADTLGGVFMCEGYSGYGVLVAEADLRMSVFFGHVGNWYLEGAWESFQSFNSTSGKVEWRLMDGVPFATIVRWTIQYETVGEPSDDDNDNDNGNVLVISKVGQPGIAEGCIVGYVDARANDNANELAQEVADTVAISFQCRVDEPEFHGEEGILTPVAVRSFGP